MTKPVIVLLRAQLQTKVRVMGHEVLMASYERVIGDRVVVSTTLQAKGHRQVMRI